MTDKPTKHIFIQRFEHTDILCMHTEVVSRGVARTQGVGFPASIAHVSNYTHA